MKKLASNSKRVLLFGEELNSSLTPDRDLVPIWLALNDRAGYTGYMNMSNMFNMFPAKKPEVMETTPAITNEVIEGVALKSEMFGAITHTLGNEKTRSILESRMAVLKTEDPERCAKLQNSLKRFPDLTAIAA